VLTGSKKGRLQKLMQLFSNKGAGGY